jgi:hypothetical protein
MAAVASQNIYRLKVWLCDISPVIWRRLEVPAGITLPKLHRVIQVAIGWQDYHLHQFRIGGRIYEVPDPEGSFESEALDARRVRLEMAVTKVGSEFGYLYDFGDGWEHKLCLEAITVPEEAAYYPRCTGGARSGPPEDAGGPYGYIEYLEALSDPNHERHGELLQWRGPFDPEAFDLNRINRELSKEFSQKVRRRSSS